MSTTAPLHDPRGTRAPARHCPELLRKGPTHDELLALLSRAGARLARRLSGALAPLLGGEAPAVGCTAAQTGDPAALRGAIAPLAANSLMVVDGDARDGGAPLLVSLAADAVLRIVDRAFGGRGEAPKVMPAQFPMAAEMMIARLDALVAEHLTAAVAAITAMPGMPAGPRHAAGGAITALRRDGSLAALAPFGETQPLILLTLEIDDGPQPWPLTLAMPLGTLARLFGYADPAQHPATSALRREAQADSMPFGDVPLTLSAVVVDMAVPFAAVAGLEVGQLLPVTVARQIPLRIAGHRGTGATIAVGVIGAVDDRVAVQITKAF